MISEADHIHNKAIFDAVNEAMNLVRPYGIYGEPTPWSNARAKRNGFLQPMNDQKVLITLEKILNSVKAQVLSWASIRAGQIGDFKNQSSNEIQKIIANQQRSRSIEAILVDEIHLAAKYGLQYADDGAMSKL